jgi:hypothetical protein
MSGFWTQLLSFKKDGKFLMLWAAQTEAHTKKAGPLFYNNKQFFL